IELRGTVSLTAGCWAAPQQQSAAINAPFMSPRVVAPILISPRSQDSKSTFWTIGEYRETVDCKFRSSTAVQFCVLPQEIWPTVNAGDRTIASAFWCDIKNYRRQWPILRIARSLTSSLRSMALHNQKLVSCFFSRGGHMLYYALIFLVIALIAGLLGFGGIAFAAAGIAR